MSQTRNIDRLGQSLVWLLALIALVVFTTIYLPSHRRTRSQEKQLTGIRDRITKLRTSNERLGSICVALETKQPAAISEAIREVLHKGDKGEFILEQ